MQQFSSLFIRRSIVTCLMVISSLFVIPITSSAQSCGGLGVPGNVTSSGTKFLLVFMKNEDPGYDKASTQYQDVYLAALQDPATVTITCRAFPGWSKVFNLPAHGSATYRLSTDPIIGFPNQDALIEVPEVIDSTVFKVEATTPITCYGMNNKRYTADAFLALPYNSATPNYTVMAYTNSVDPQLGDPQTSEFAVASFDNNNTVTITPAAITSTGSAAGAPMTFVLDSDECVQIQGSNTDRNGDMTGSTISSTRPVVVYAGSSRSEIPAGFTYSQGGGQNTSRDHLCEAMPPVSTWGYSFVAKNFGRPDGDLMRVLASTDNTVVKINGQVWGAPLNKNQFRDTLIPQSALALDNVVAVESDTGHTMLVGMFAHTADATSQVGDPFLAIVPPLQQTYNDFTFFLSNDNTNYIASQQFLVIATEQSGAGRITIDGTITIPASSYTMLPYTFKNNHKYAITTVNLAPGIHRIVSQNLTPGDGFTILAYGWGTLISYGYTAGQLLVPLRGISPINPPVHGSAPGPNPAPASPSITVRNIISEKVYFDSARVSYSQNPQNINVRLKKDIAMETGTIDMGTEKTLDLVTSQPVQSTISGSIRIWYHSPLWMNMYPVDFPFVITPQSQAGVSASPEQAILLENYPNPSTGNTTIHFALPERAHASVKIYDALGRTVKIVTQGMVNSGDQEIQISTKALIPGEYTLELSSPELGISQHSKMIVVE